MNPQAGSLVALSEITKSFGAVKALAGVDLTVMPGECIGIVGHNGAGKSTLMQILAGTLAYTNGHYRIADRELATSEVTVATARAAGIRCVFQELSLCPNLTAVENVRVRYGAFSGLGWREKARRALFEKLNVIFPGHGIAPGDLVADMSLGRRQMLEIAINFMAVENDTPRLVILDEPTSSLDQSAADQLLAFSRKFVSGGGSIILISHILGDIFSTAERVVVMRDGRVVADRPVSEFDRNSLVTAMGHISAELEEHVAAERRTAAAGAPIVSARTPRDAAGSVLKLHRGEIVGLAGLAGHGQTAMLRIIHRAAFGRSRFASIDGRVAFVAGDRQADGIFPLWSIGQNVTIRSLAALSRFGVVSRKRAKTMEEEWQARLKIRTPDMDDNILTLSGGNQQKSLFARALASDADIIVMDDPMRGVDVGTRQEVYGLIRAEAERGRSFLWYTTEFDELVHCDRVYVFREGVITAELDRSELTEERVLHSSFETEAA